MFTLIEMTDMEIMTTIMPSTLMTITIQVSIPDETVKFSYYVNCDNYRDDRHGNNDNHVINANDNHDPGVDS